MRVGKILNRPMIPAAVVRCSSRGASGFDRVCVAFRPQYMHRASARRGRLRPWSCCTGRGGVYDWEAWGDDSCVVGGVSEGCCRLRSMEALRLKNHRIIVHLPISVPWGFSLLNVV